MKTLFSFLILFVTLVIGTSAQQAPVRKVHFNLENSGLAIQGYDPVAYIVSNKAVEGKSAITTEYNGVTYRFSTTKNRDAFKANPSKYEPQYGGWCAYAMGANGKK